MAAYSLIELLFALGLAATIGAVAIPGVTASLDEARALGAARYVSTQLHRTRMEAIARNRATAMRFVRTASGYGIESYADGNGNGMLSSEILRGIDRPTRATERLPEQFTGIDFGTLPGLPPVDPSGAPPGADPIRLGSSDMATFTPLGTATSGSLYLLSPHHTQYVVRIFGETGKTRLLKFDARSRQWTSLSGA